MYLIKQLSLWLMKACVFDCDVTVIVQDCGEQVSHSRPLIFIFTFTALQIFRRTGVHLPGRGKDSVKVVYCFNSNFVLCSFVFFMHQLYMNSYIII